MVVSGVYLLLLLSYSCCGRVGCGAAAEVVVGGGSWTARAFDVALNARLDVNASLPPTYRITGVTFTTAVVVNLTSAVGRVDLPSPARGDVVVVFERCRFDDRVSFILPSADISGTYTAPSALINVSLAASFPVYDLALLDCVGRRSIDIAGNVTALVRLRSLSTWAFVAADRARQEGERNLIAPQAHDVTIGPRRLLVSGTNATEGFRLTGLFLPAILALRSPASAGASALPFASDHLGYVFDRCVLDSSTRNWAGLELSHSVFESLPIHIANSDLKGFHEYAHGLRLNALGLIRNAVVIVTNVTTYAKTSDFNRIGALHIQAVHAELNSGLYFRNVDFLSHTSTSATFAVANAIYVRDGNYVQGYVHAPLSTADVSCAVPNQLGGESPSFAIAVAALCAAAKRSAISLVDVARGGNNRCESVSRNAGSCMLPAGEADSSSFSLSFIAQVLNEARFHGSRGGIVAFSSHAGPATVHREPYLVPSIIARIITRDEPTAIQGARVVKGLQINFARGTAVAAGPLGNASDWAAIVLGNPDYAQHTALTRARGFVFRDSVVDAQVRMWDWRETPRVEFNRIQAHSVWVLRPQLGGCGGQTGGVFWIHACRFENDRDYHALHFGDFNIHRGAIVVTNSRLYGIRGLSFRDINATGGTDVRILRTHIHAYHGPAYALTLQDVHVTGGSALRVVRSTIYGQMLAWPTFGEGRGLLCLGNVTIGHSPLYALPPESVGLSAHSSRWPTTLQEAIPQITRMYAEAVLADPVTNTGFTNATLLRSLLPTSADALFMLENVTDDTDDRVLRWGANFLRAQRKSSEITLDCAASTHLISAAFTAHLLRGSRVYGSNYPKRSAINAIPAPMGFGRHPFSSIHSNVELNIRNLGHVEREWLALDGSGMPPAGAQPDGCAQPPREGTLTNTSLANVDRVTVSHSSFTKMLLFHLGPCTYITRFEAITAARLQIAGGTVLSGGMLHVVDVRVTTGYASYGLVFSDVEWRLRSRLAIDHFVGVTSGFTRSALHFLRTIVDGADVVIRGSVVRTASASMMGSLVFEGAVFRNGATFDIASTKISGGAVYGSKARPLAIYPTTTFNNSTFAVRDTRILQEGTTWGYSVRFGGDADDETSTPYFTNDSVVAWHNVYVDGHIGDLALPQPEAGAPRDDLRWVMRLVQLSPEMHYSNRPSFYGLRGGATATGTSFTLSCLVRRHRFVSTLDHVGLPGTLATLERGADCEDSVGNHSILIDPTDASAALFELPVCDVADSYRDRWQFAANVSACRRSGQTARTVRAQHNHTAIDVDGNRTLHVLWICYATCAALETEYAAFARSSAMVDAADPFTVPGSWGPLLLRAMRESGEDGCGADGPSTPTPTMSHSHPSVTATATQATGSASPTVVDREVPSSATRTRGHRPWEQSVLVPTTTSQRQRTTTSSSVFAASSGDGATAVRTHSSSIAVVDQQRNAATLRGDAAAKVRLTSSIDVLAQTSGPVTAFAGFLVGPAVANKGANVGRLAGIAACHLEDDAEDVDDPPWYKYVLPVALRIEHHDDHDDDDTGSEQDDALVFPRALGAIASTTAVLLLGAVAVLVVAVFAAPSQQRPRKYAGVAFSVLLSYYGPNVVAIAVLVAEHSVLASERVVAGVACAAVVVLFAVSGVIIHRINPGVAVRVHRYLAAYDETASTATVSGDAPTAEEHQSSAVAAAWVLAPLIESARDPVPHYIRAHVLEDIAAALAMGFIAGVKPPEGTSCVGVASAMLVVAMAHLVYIGAVRPYLDTWEQRFAATTAALQTMVAGAMVAVTVAAYNNTDTSNDTGNDNGGTSAVLTVAAVLVFALAGLLYVQMVALAVLELKRIRRRVWRTTAAPKDTETGGEPLLAIPSAAPGEPNTRLSASHPAASNDSGASPAQPDPPMSNPLARGGS